MAGSDVHFVIFSHQRSGTNRLKDILNQHPDIFCASEIFFRDAPVSQQWVCDQGLTPYDGTASDAPRFLNAFFEHTAHAFPGKNVGFKVFHDHVPWHVQWRWLKNPQYKKILLRRDNLLRACLSHELAYQTRQYSVLPGEKPIDPEPFEVNLEHIYYWMEANKMWLSACRRLLIQTHQPFVDCSFSDDWPQTTSKCLSLLGTTPLDHYDEPYQKMSSHHRIKLITNLDEIEKSFACDRFGYLNPDTPRRKDVEFKSKFVFRTRWHFRKRILKAKFGFA